MIRRILETLVLGCLVVAGVLGIVAVTPSVLERETRATPPQDASAVCQPLGSGQLFVGNATQMGPVGSAAKPVEPGSEVTVEGPVVLRGQGGLVGGILSRGNGGMSWTPCERAVTGGALVVPSSRGASLLVVNPDSTEAIVDLTIHGPDGELVPLGARGIAVGAGQTREVALSVLADVEGPVGVTFQTSRGRVSVVARLGEPAVEAGVAGQLGTDHLLPGVPAGAQRVSVLVTNPGRDRAEVRVRALGVTPDYEPAGGTALVEPGATVALALDAALAGEASTLRVTSDQEVAASLAVGAPDTALVAPVQAGTELQGLVPDGGVLQLTAPGADARVKLEVDGQQQDLSVARGTTLALPEAVRGRVRLTSDQPVTAAVVYASEQGQAIAPLQSPQGTGAAPVAATVDPHLN